MHFIYPCLPYQPRAVDPMWAPEYEWARQQGLATGLVDVDSHKVWLGTPAAATKPTQVLYRGWMLMAAEYDRLARLLPLAVSPAGYLSSHHATGWYEAVASHTFVSRFVTEPTALDFAAGRRYFVKGPVKSFADSVVASQQELAGFWQRHELPAGTPLFVRDFAELKPASERRFFVVRGQVFGAGGAVLPVSLRTVVPALRPHLFYSLDVAETLAGQPVLVEIGDGQVSDLKEWSVAEFGSRVVQALATANDTP